jgi:chitodextrinase
MKTTKLTATAALLGLIANTEAKIEWTFGNLYNLKYSSTTKLSVQNGIVSSTDTSTSERLAAATPLEGDMSGTYETKANVIRVKGIMSEDDFEDTLFPKRNSIYTYDAFLEAIAKFDKFCNENHLGDTVDDDEACKIELSTLFAHFAQESGYHGGTIKIDGEDVEEWQQGLYHVHEDGCPDDKGVVDEHCKKYRSGTGHWATDAYPMPAGVQYYGRGPFQLSWNSNFGEFSEMLGESTYDGKTTLLNNPGQVETDSVKII